MPMNSSHALGRLADLILADRHAAARRASVFREGRPQQGRFPLRGALLRALGRARRP